MKRQMIMLCLAVIVELLSSGCAMLIVQPGKYARTLREGKSQEDVRARIGSPIFTSVPTAAATNRVFRTSVSDERYSFDVFKVHGKIWEPDSDRVVGYGMMSGMTFLLAEVILTPAAIYQVCHESFTDRHLKVWYDESLKYLRHDTMEIRESEQPLSPGVDKGKSVPTSE
jgi:hypothetical protein